MNNVGIINLSFDRLVELLHLPKEYKVLRVMEPNRWQYYNIGQPTSICIVIEGPLMPKVSEGSEIHPVTLAINSNTGDSYINEVPT